jgi:ATP-dependent Clp protease ATP-binding subunit ClpA
MSILSKMFAPEFRNRLDAIIQFKPLPREAILRVVDKMVMELEAALERNDVTVELDPGAREWLAEKGYDPAMGARPMARVIQEHIKRPLAEQLLFGDLAGGGHVHIVLNADGTLGLKTVPNTRQLEHLAETGAR